MDSEGGRPGPEVALAPISTEAVLAAKPLVDPKDAWGTPEPQVSPIPPDEITPVGPIPELILSDSGPASLSREPDGAPEAVLASGKDARDKAIESAPKNDQINAEARNAIRLLRVAINTDGSFLTSNSKQLAEALIARYKDTPDSDLSRLDMRDIDIKTVLLALGGIDVSGGARDAKVIANIDAAEKILSQNTEITSGSETRSLEEWKKNAADPSSPDQDLAQAALRDGKYKLKFDPEPAAATPVVETPQLPDKYKDKSDREILDLEIADQMKVIEAKLIEAKRAKNEEEVKELESIRDEYRLGKQGKGDNGAWGNAGVLKRVDRYLRSKGEPGVDALVLEKATGAGDKAFEEFALHLKQLGQNEQTIGALREYYNNGQVSEIIKSRADKWMVENYLGLKGKTDEQIRNIINTLISDDEKKQLLKKFGSNLSLAAILILAATNAIKDGFSTALSDK